MVDLLTVLRLKEKTIVQVQVIPEAQNRYIPDSLHSVIGYVWDCDPEHLWVKSFVSGKNAEGKQVSHVVGPHRYLLDDIRVEILPLT